MEIALVVAMDEEGVIGREGRLPWHLPADLRRFREITMGKPVIMGRRTWEAIGRALPGRRNIVLTSQEGFEAEGGLVAGSPEEALELAGRAPEVMVIGGAEIYALFLPRARRLYVTLVGARVSGDTLFPPHDPSAWTLVSREDRAADADNLFPLSFRILERRLPGPEPARSGRARGAKPPARRGK